MSLFIFLLLFFLVFIMLVDGSRRLTHHTPSQPITHHCPITTRHPRFAIHYPPLYPPLSSTSSFRLPPSSSTLIILHLPLILSFSSSTSPWQPPQHPSTPSSTSQISSSTSSSTFPPHSQSLRLILQHHKLTTPLRHLLNHLHPLCNHPQHIIRN